MPSNFNQSRFFLKKPPVNNVSASAKSAAIYFSTFVRRSSIVFSVVCGVIQFCRDQSLENSISIAFVLFVGLPLAVFLLDRKFYEKAPLASFLALMFPVVNLILPLVLTTLEGNLITYNLSEPFKTFGGYAFFSIIVTLSLLAYLHNKKGNELHASLNGFLERRLDLFKSPGVTQIWIFGSVGFLSLAYTFLFSSRAGGIATTPIGKVLEAFSPYAYMPVLLLLPALLGLNARKVRGNWLLVGVYAVSIFILATASNVRGIIGIMLITPILVGFVSSISGYTDFRRIGFLTKVLFLGFGFIAIFGLGHLALSMEIARATRGQSTAAEMFAETQNAALSPSAVANYLDQRASINGWDEFYLSNPVFNRLVSVKFTDNAFYLADSLGEIERLEIRSFIFKRILTYFPRVISDRLPVAIDKSTLTSFSYGDYLLYLSKGDQSVLGGFRTGAMLPLGFLAFGVWFPVVFFIACFLLFWVLELFVHKSHGFNYGMMGVSRISPLILTFIYTCTFFLQTESITDIVGFFFRVLPQMVFLYFVLFMATRWISGGG